MTRDFLNTPIQATLRGVSITSRNARAVQAAGGVGQWRLHTVIGCALTMSGARRSRASVRGRVKSVAVLTEFVAISGRDESVRLGFPVPPHARDATRGRDLNSVACAHDLINDH
jgi:hypothetical protein